MDAKAAFASEFALPLLVTALFVLHYVTVDTWAVGAARTPYQLKYPSCGEGRDVREMEPFFRALRSQQNIVEQAWAFFLVMWACAFSLDATYAGACGCVWGVARVAYGYLYRVTPSRNKLMYTTVPAYAAQAAACGGILAALLPLPPVPAAAVAAAVVSSFVGYGWFGYRNWFMEHVKAEKRDLEQGLMQ